MKGAILADTGPLYAAVDPDDQYHERAQQELISHSKGQRRVMLAYSTLLEAYTLILYRLGIHAAFKWLDEIQRGSSLINPSAEDYRQAIAKLAHYNDQPLTLFDATLAVLAERLEISVWTYDHHFDAMRAPVWR